MRIESYVEHGKSGLLVMLALSTFVSCGRSDSTSKPSDGQLEAVELALNWFPDAQHGGFFAAQVHGFFRAEGLDVTILPGGPNVPVIQNVASRRVAFAVGNADQILLGRAQQADVVALFAPLQDSPRCILVHEDSGIKRFDQIRNMTLALGSGKVFARYLKSRVPLQGVQIVPYLGNIGQMLRDKNFAQQGYIFSEPLVAQRNGLKVRCLMISELGFNPYSSVLFTHAELIATRPDLVGRMVRAVGRGWQRYLESPEKTNRSIHAQNPEMDLESLAFGAQAIRPLCLPDGVSPEEIGTLAPDRWQTLADQLLELGLLKEGFSPKSAFDAQFLVPQNRP